MDPRTVHDFAFKTAKSKRYRIISTATLYHYREKAEARDALICLHTATPGPPPRPLQHLVGRHSTLALLFLFSILVMFPFNMDNNQCEHF